MIIAADIYTQEPTLGEFLNIHLKNSILLNSLQGRQTDRQQTVRQTKTVQSNRQTDSQTNRQTDTHIDRQTRTCHMHTCSVHMHMHTHTQKHTHTHTQLHAQKAILINKASTPFKKRK